MLLSLRGIARARRLREALRFEEVRVPLQRQISRAVEANKIPGVVTGAVFGLFAVFFTMDNEGLADVIPEAVYDAGQTIGSRKYANANYVTLLSSMGGKTHYMPVLITN